MAQPSQYVRTTNFTEYAASHTSAPYNPADHDAELNNLAVVFEEMRRAIATVVRDDGTPTSTPGTVTGGGTWNVRGQWLAGTAYIVGDMVEKDGASYVCATAHTSSIFANDRSKWVLVATTVTTTSLAASDITVTPTGNLSSLNAASALNELQGDIDVANASIESLNLTTAAQTSSIVGLQGVNAITDNGRRNRVLNGSFAVDQRNGGNALAVTTSRQWAADRWSVVSSANPSGSVTTTRNIGAPASDPYAFIRLRRSLGASYAGIVTMSHVMELDWCYGLIGNTVTVRFAARAGSNWSAGALNVKVVYGTTPDQGSAALLNSTWTGQATAVNSAQSITSGWVTYTITTTIPSTAREVALQFVTGNFGGTAGTNDFIDIAEVQVYVGSIALPFEYVDYHTTLWACLRYFERMQARTYGYNNTNNNANCAPVTFMAPKRITPTISLNGITYTNGSALTIGSIDKNTFATSLTFAAAGGATAAFTYDADAEL